MKDIHFTLLTAGPAASLVLGTAALMIFQKLSFAGMCMIAGGPVFWFFADQGAIRGLIRNEKGHITIRGAGCGPDVRVRFKK